MRFETPSRDECQRLIERLRDKRAEEIVGILGQPARETGARKEERLYDGVPRVVEIRRTLFFYDIGQTVHRLKVVERIDGQCELHMSGREIPDDPAA